jgi:hypothetical protein
MDLLGVRGERREGRRGESVGGGREGGRDFVYCLIIYYCA